MSTRSIKRTVRASPTVEGAGVRLHRAFGFGDTASYDPFLLLDDFRNDNPDDYVAGFPWHPHRGIETVTYMLAGTVQHGDSLGNQGTLRPGDVQWMTAGNGILHQEMPSGDEDGRMYGFQLWVNLPASLKMTAPRYQDIKSAEIPSVEEDDGTVVRILCGHFGEKRGPVDGIAANPRFLDVRVPPNTAKRFPVEKPHTAFAYVFEGAGSFHSAPEQPQDRTADASSPDSSAPIDSTGNRSLVLFDKGDEVAVTTGETGIRFLLVSGKPLEEPVAWRGPIVMNTDAELQRAYAQLRDGTFIQQSAE